MGERRKDFQQPIKELILRELLSAGFADVDAQVLEESRVQVDKEQFVARCVERHRETGTCTTRESLGSTAGKSQSRMAAGSTSFTHPFIRDTFVVSLLSSRQCASQCLFPLPLPSPEFGRLAGVQGCKRCHHDVRPKNYCTGVHSQISWKHHTVPTGAGPGLNCRAPFLDDCVRACWTHGALGESAPTAVVLPFRLLALGCSLWSARWCVRVHSTAASPVINVREALFVTIKIAGSMNCLCQIFWSSVAAVHTKPQRR